MRLAAVLVSAGVVLVANAFVWLSVSSNRSEALGGTVELTERELLLPARSGESTAVFLELDWDTLSSSPERRRAPRWLDAAKLSELGLDCSVDVTHADAREHYYSMITASVLVVLEYEGEAWKQADPDRGRSTRLFAVDAGRDPLRLREKYAEATRYIITRGLVRLDFEERSSPEGKRLARPRLQGLIVQVLPDRIFVPRPYSEALEDLRQDNETSRDRAEEEPRFAVTVSWGANHEPWVSGVRRIEAD